MGGEFWITAGGDYWITTDNFMSDALWSGRRFRTFNVIDDYNRVHQPALPLQIKAVNLSNCAFARRSARHRGGQRVVISGNLDYRRLGLLGYS
jgi:hypothetical protein